MSEGRLQVRVVMMPKDTNGMGNIFGGVILSQLDLAAGEHARRLYPQHKFVTKIMREVNFLAPVKVGDAVSFYTDTVRVGKTSVTVNVRVEVERNERSYPARLDRIDVTSAEVVMVAIDESGKAKLLELVD
jgi:acyl-CoA thioesterase YciA